MGNKSSKIPEYEPSILDVLVVKAMLYAGTPLPLPIIYEILDKAEYWPHTTTGVTYPYPHKQIMEGDFSENNLLLLRTPPLGFPSWPTRSSSYPSHRGIHFAIPACPPGDTPFPPAYFKSQIGTSTALLAHPCRKIVFRIRSHAQGWEGEEDDRDLITKIRECQTWFEAGIERWYDDGMSVVEGETGRWEGCAIEDLSTVYPQVRTVEGKGGAYVLDQDALVPPGREIHRNINFLRRMHEACEIWRHTDYLCPEGEEWQAYLWRKYGLRDGWTHGHFVRNLRLGDVVTVWGKARGTSGAWVNNVESVEVDVYWSV
ncbi:hypothetical protein EJ06DRAFT_559224 [Trichodelitschia bisporula]|uniref:Uncharacterized protein n=1 Tax=Trichodelitschia bisporula TaxID=703511 RepID=A0A6G1HMV9_9PEZI|nr:hypothetical protein EJ06DRAFT_559224 [Trichodelitschia bisporula]